MVTLKDIVDCYIPRPGVEVVTTKCAKYGSWTVEIRNEHGLCFRKSDYEPDWQDDLERELAYYCLTISQAMEEIKAEPTQIIRNMPARRHDSQRMITKRIIGRWLHKQGIKVVGNRYGRYVIDNGAVELKFQIYDNGEVNTRRFYRGLTGIESFNGLQALINLVKEMGEE